MVLHVVSFAVPYPPDYGGVIDVWYKLRALKAAGWRITLHSFLYGSHHETPQLAEVVDKIYYYQRPRNLIQLISRTPFIAESRRNSLLLKRLGDLPPGSPILFEGLHSCVFLDDPRLADKRKIVRTHNVEHDYYRHLAKAATSLPRKAFLHLEATKLEPYEKILHHAQGIAAITESDRRHFQTHYPEVPSVTVGCFYSDSEPSDPTKEERELIPKDNFLLFGAHLAVTENARAARYIVRSILPHIDPKIPVVIAGKAPGRDILELASRDPRVRLLSDISQPLMHALTERAAINLLFTFQPTGIKLKLINTLSVARGHVLANTPMLNDPRLASLCERADTPEAQIAFIRSSIDRLPSVDELKKRRQTLESLYSNSANARILTNLLKG